MSGNRAVSGGAVVSLGSSCLPIRIYREQVVGASVPFDASSQPLPFDLNLTPYPHLLTILESDLNCVDHHQLQLTEHPWYTEKVILVDGFDGWVLPNEHEIIHRMGPDNADLIKEIVFNQLKDQYERFKTRLQSGESVSFLLEYDNYPEQLEAVLTRKFPQLRYQIILLNHSSRTLTGQGNVNVISCPYPAPRGSTGWYPWWDTELQKTSKDIQWREALGHYLRVAIEEFQVQPA